MRNEKNRIGRIKSQIIGEIGKFRMTRPDLTLLPIWNDRELLKTEIEALARIVESEEVSSSKKEVALGDKWLSGAKTILHMVAEGTLDEDQASSLIKKELRPIADLLLKRTMQAIRKERPSKEEQQASRVAGYRIRVRQEKTLERLIRGVSQISGIPQLAAHREFYESIATILTRINDVLRVTTGIDKEVSLLKEDEVKDKEDALMDKVCALLNKVEIKLRELSLQISKVLPYLRDEEHDLCLWLSAYLNEFEDSGIEVDETSESYKFVNFIRK